MPARLVRGMEDRSQPPARSGAASAPAAGLTVRFWGVRGGIPTAGAETRAFGGNTACVEVRCGDRLLVFDAGTGIRPFGAALASSCPIDADILLTHCRFERTCGLPFFAPGYDTRNNFVVWGAASDAGGVEAALTELMTSPLFPIPLSVIGGLKEWRDFRPGDTLSPRDGIAVRTAPLNHPQGATGFRVEYGGRALAYVGSTGHVPGEPDERILALIRGADAMIYDCHHSDDDHPAGGFAGHSTWQEGARLRRRAGAGRLVAFLHHPERADAALDAVQRALDADASGSVVAYEGLELAL